MTKEEFSFLQESINFIKEYNPNRTHFKITSYKRMQSILSKVQINKIIAVADLLLDLGVDPFPEWNLSGLFEFCRKRREIKAVVTTPKDWIHNQSHNATHDIFSQISRLDSKKQRLNFLKQKGALDEHIIDVIVSKRIELAQEEWSMISNLIIDHTKVRNKNNTRFFSKGIKQLLEKAYGTEAK